MNIRLVSVLAALGAFAALPAALADHNSKWGEGWANMPNDIHNTRIDTRGDNTTFRDFVRRGNGADSVNRYSTDATGARGKRKGDAAQAKRSRARSGERVRENKRQRVHQPAGKRQRGG